MGKRRAKTLHAATTAALLILAGCLGLRTSLPAATERARAALAAIRSGPSLSDVRDRLWTPEVSPAEPPDAGDLLSGRRVGAGLDDWGELLLGLRIATPRELSALRQKLVEFDPDSLEGLAVPGRGEVFVKASSVELVAHELTHVLSAREGYPERWRDVVLPPEAPDDLVDIDALVGVWCRSEGEAVVTGRAAAACDAGGRSAAEEAPSDFPEVDIAESGRRMSVRSG